MLTEVLRALSEGSTLSELCQRLGSTPQALAQILERLRRGGYVVETSLVGGECAKGGGCANCKLLKLCSKAKAPAWRLWRLTAKGRAAVAARPSPGADPLRG